MSEVVFYQLRDKFLERAEDIPETAKEVVYHALAIGHHVGVFDCFRPMLRVDDAAFDRLLDGLPAGEARRKLEGVKRFGEIMVDRTHTRLLSSAFAQARASLDAESAAIVERLGAALAAIEAEPAVYLMGRRLQ